MENSGWIYFRVVEGRGYCFGKTDNRSRRDSEYRKENPWVEKVYDFFVADMHAVEAEIIRRTRHLRLLENSKEWIQLCDEAREIMNGVREQYALMSYAEWDQIRSAKKPAVPQRRCPGCTALMSYDGPGYRCRQCGIQTM